MFDSIGLSEIMVLLLGALFIFGPDRLPGLARDAAGALKRLRQTVTGARGQIHEQLGPEFDHLKDVDLRSLNPKTFIKKHLLEDDPYPTVHRRSDRSSPGDPSRRTTAAASDVTVAAAAPVTFRIEPPFDSEAT